MPGDHLNQFVGLRSDGVNAEVPSVTGKVLGRYQSQKMSVIYIATRLSGIGSRQLNHMQR